MIALRRLLAATAGAFLLATPASSQGVPGLKEGDQAGLKIAPTKYEASLVPGQPVDGVVDVFNLGQGALTVQTGVENVRMVGEAGELEFFVGDNPFRLNSFVEIDKTPFTLGAGEARKVRFRITVPAGVYPGGYFGVITITAQPPGEPAGEGAVIRQSGRVGTLLILSVEGDQDRKGEIRSIRTTSSPLGDRRTFAISYANTGSASVRPLGVAYRPTGTVTVKNLFGLTVAKREISGEIVFPEASRSFTADLRKPFWFGPYTAEFEIAPGDNQTRTESVRFWAVSWQSLAAILGIAAAVIILMRVRRRDRAARRRPPPIS